MSLFKILKELVKEMYCIIIRFCGGVGKKEYKIFLVVRMWKVRYFYKINFMYVIFLIIGLFFCLLICVLI